MASYGVFKGNSDYMNVSLCSNPLEVHLVVSHDSQHCLIKGLLGGGKEAQPANMAGYIRSSMDVYFITCIGVVSLKSKAKGSFNGTIGQALWADIHES